MAVREIPHRYLNFVILLMISALVQTNIYLLVPNFEYISQEFRIGDAMIGLMSGFYVIVIGISTLLWSILADRMETRKIIMVMNLVLALFFSALSYFIFDFTWFLLSQLALAFFIGSLSPIIYSFITDLFEPGERITSLNIWNIISSIGSGIGFIIGLITGFFGEWRLSILSGGIALMIAVVFSLIVKEPIRGMSDPQISQVLIEKKLRYPYRLSLNDLGKAITRNRTNLLMISQAVLVYIAWGAFSTWSMHAIIRQANTSSVVATIILGIASAGNLGSLVFSPIADKVRRRNPRKVVILASVALVIETITLSTMLILIPKINISSEDLISSLFIAFRKISSDLRLQVAIGIGAIGLFANSIISPIRDSIIADINLPENRATMISIITISIFLGRGIGIFTVGLLSQYFGSLIIGIILTQLSLIPASFLWLRSREIYIIDLNEFSSIMETRRLDLIRGFTN